MDAQISQYIEELAATYPAITSAWLIGSRANGTAKPTSDWDILLFSDEAVVKAIAGNDRFHRKDVDLLIVKESGQFEKPWGIPKSGSLARWQWQQESPLEASYVEVKFIPDAPDSQHGEMVEKRVRAIRVYPPKG